MKKKYFLIGALAVCTLCACQPHDHEHGEEGHDHEAELSSGETQGSYTEYHDEIILPPEKAKAAGIQTEVVRPDTFRQIIPTGGQILPAQGTETAVVATTSGVVKLARTLAAGMAVTKGNTLFTLSAGSIQGGDPVERAYITYQNARTEYERALPLAEKQIVSRKELERLKAAYEDARVNYEALAPQHTEKGVSVQAPITGYIKNIAVKEGDYVSTGQTLATVSQSRRLRLRADVSERYYQMLPHLTSACFKTPYDNKVYALEQLNGRLLSYGKTPDDSSYYLPVTFEFDNAGNIVPGSFVEVSLLGSKRSGVISLPVSALTEEQGAYFVYLQVDSEGYRKQEVKTGADNGLRVEILSGLKTGDRVVTQGAYHVRLAAASNAIPAHTHSH